MATKKVVGARAKRTRRDSLRVRAVKSQVKTYVTKVKRLIAGGTAEESDASLQEAISALDKAAEKGIIHKNKAARHKSRLMRQLNAIRG